MKKNIILAIAATLTAMAAHAGNDTKTALVIELAAGDTATFVLDEQPKLTFSDTSLYITSATYEAEYALNDLHRYSFRQVQSSGITATEAGRDGNLRQNGGTVTISGMAPGTAVKVYSTGGVAVSSASADSGGRVTVDIAPLPAGVYIVKYGDNTTKIRKL